MNRKLTPIISLICFGLYRSIHAVSPAPDGGYAGYNTAEGQNALNALTTGTFNTALGAYSLYTNTTGGSNTAVGTNALRSNSSSERNTAVGVNALFANTTNGSNTAVGYLALRFSTGASNTAIGDAALVGNTIGSQNGAVGSSALFSNVSGVRNNAIGHTALYLNVSGNFNNAFGARALLNSTGSANNAFGDEALVNTTGSFNTAMGDFALGTMQMGSNNVAVGISAGASNTSGSGNVYIGANINGVDGESNSCYIASIFGQTSTSGTAVYINSSGKLGTVTSSRRFKDDIKPMADASEAILALKPVTFHYKKEIDPAGFPQFGLVAEDVEKVNPELVLRDKDGKVNTVRYEAVNAMLLNEFLKEHRKIEQLEATVAALAARLKEQDARIDKVSARQEKRTGGRHVAME